LNNCESMNTFHQLFHEQWGHLNDPHVRALAWLLVSPNLLDGSLPELSGRVAHLSEVQPYRPADVVEWLTQLDQNPTRLHEAIALHQTNRLGLYAEKLLGFYFKHLGCLFANNLQIHGHSNETLGEFDFLLNQANGLLHLELATKFYLFDEHIDADAQANLFDYFGPNLNDTLGAKLGKIFNQQLLLGRHEASLKILTKPVAKAQALVKGWLFYHAATNDDNLALGISSMHCRGFWWTQSEFEQLNYTNGLILERLSWLAPAQVDADDVVNKSFLTDAIARRFQVSETPVLVAIMKRNGNVMQEFCRGMVVPNRWPDKVCALRDIRARTVSSL
jgi:hypothetical protein